MVFGRTSLETSDGVPADRAACSERKIARPELATLRVVAEPCSAAIPRKHRWLQPNRNQFRSGIRRPALRDGIAYESRYFTICCSRCFTRADCGCRRTCSTKHRSIDFSRWCAPAGRRSIRPAAAASLKIADCQLRPLKSCEADPGRNVPMGGTRLYANQLLTPPDRNRGRTRTLAYRRPLN